MSEFRFTGVSPTGQSVQGTVYAKNKRTAQKKISNLADQHSFQLRELEQRMIFRYKIRNSEGKVVKGEQKAYNASEIRLALERMGMEVVSIQKKLLNMMKQGKRTHTMRLSRVTKGSMTKHSMGILVRNLAGTMT